MITRKEMQTMSNKRELLENIREYFDRIIGYDDIERELDRDFITRKVITDSIIKDIVGDKELLYVEAPMDIESKIEIKNKYGQEVADLSEFLAADMLTRKGTLASTIIDATSEFEREIRKNKIGFNINKNFEFIILSTEAFQETLSSNRYASKLWALVHEVMHSFPTPERNETIVQRKTFDWLLKYGYTTSILSELADQILRAVGNMNLDNDSSYIIVNYILTELRSKDYDLLYTFFIALEDMFYDDNISDTVVNSNTIVEIRQEIERLKQKHL